MPLDACAGQGIAVGLCHDCLDAFVKAQPYHCRVQAPLGRHACNDSLNVFLVPWVSDAVEAVTCLAFYLPIRFGMDMAQGCKRGLLLRR